MSGSPSSAADRRRAELEAKRAKLAELKAARQAREAERRAEQQGREVRVVQPGGDVPRPAQPSYESRI